MKNNSFRYDINGLRAYAVILVVLFHFGIFGFAAGFIGVDIFFVISGLLMTSLVVNGLEKDNFSLLNFYLARGIRIVPALLVVSVIVLILGWFFLLPPDYKALAKHTLSSINFFSNIVYWKESGYFDADSHNKALLHTWSLSIEWQFYLIFPIIISLIYRIKKSRIFLLIFFILGIIISFILSIIITSKNPSTGFFLLPMRAWEMLIGGLIFFIPRDKVHYKKPLEIIGFSLILVSCFLFSTSTLWPSYNAILPVLGAFLILLAHQQNSIFTRGIFFQWLGNNSYSIYLWHWPIVFFLHYFYKNNDYYFIMLGISLSIFLGWLSYVFIEGPTRKKLSSLSKKKTYIIWILSVSILSLVSLIIFKFDGVKSRFSLEIQDLVELTYDINPRRNECHSSLNGLEIKSCLYGNGPISLIVIGDSHADGMLNSVIHALPKDTSLITFTIDGCQTILGLKRINSSTDYCGERVQRILNIIHKDYKKIPLLVINRSNSIFHGAFGDQQPEKYINNIYNNFSKEYLDEMQQGYLKTFKQFSKENPVFVTRPTPEAHTNIPALRAKIELYGIDENFLKIPISEYKERSNLSWETQNIAVKKYGIKTIDLSKEFCDEIYCYFTKSGLPIFYDDDHMSWTASLMLTSLFKKQIFDEK